VASGQFFFLGGGAGIIQGLFKDFKVLFQTYASHVLRRNIRVFNVCGSMKKPLRAQN